MNVINFPTVNVAFAEACKARSAESERVTKLEHENFDMRTALAAAVLAAWRDANPTQFTVNSRRSGDPYVSELIAENLALVLLRHKFR